MKKIIILLIVLFASLDNFGQFSFGPKIGYTTSKLSTDYNDIKESAKSNFQFGVFFRFGKKLYLQPEIYYATGGGTLKITSSDAQEEIKLKSLCIPALIGYKLIDTKVFNIRVFAGPVANFIMDKNVESSDLITDPLQDSDIKNIAWGLDVGAGADVFFLSLDLRYEFGLNNIYNPPDDSGIQSIKSNVFVVSLGFKFM